jgi:uncharacterized spore protein YtfJ
MPNIDELLAGAREAITVRRVFGDPLERDGVTIVPAALVRGGGGGGGDKDGNGGGGFGVSAAPAGVYVVEDGHVEWKPAVNVNRIVLGSQLVAGLALLTAWSLLRRRSR